MLSPAAITREISNKRLGDILNQYHRAGKRFAEKFKYAAREIEPAVLDEYDNIRARIFGLLDPFVKAMEAAQTAEEKAKLWGIRHLIIGGGAIDDELEKQLKGHPHAVWSTYGMTETLSHIALRRLNGPEASSWYTPFEGVGISQNEDGCLVIDAPEVAESTLVTHDIVEIAADGRRFKVLGRKDNVICSGGIKIQIEEVERLLRPHLATPFLVSKRPDKVLGEAVALLTEAADLASIEEICRTVLPPYWRPRHYQHTGHLPLTETGKPARAEAERIIRDSSAGRQT